MVCANRYAPSAVDMQLHRVSDLQRTFLDRANMGKDFSKLFLGIVHTPFGAIMTP
jgi:hypothetical protein